MPKKTAVKAQVQPTGIKEFDEILGGGLPQGSTVILSGSPGTGKTILAQQWLFEGYAKYKEPGLYIGFTESNQKTINNLKQFSFYQAGSVGPKKVHIVDFRDIMHKLAFRSSESVPTEDLGEVIDVIRHLADTTGAKRIVFDSVTAILNLIVTPLAVRDFIFNLGESLSQIDANIILVSEEPEGSEGYGQESFIADGIIKTSNQVGQLQMIRRLNILKLRGSSFRSGPVIFEIEKSGIKLYPKIPSYTAVAKTDFNKRLGVGIKGLDSLMGGGIPQGHAMLVGGNTGSGKSTFGLHFVAEGIKNKENCVFVALEESVTQVVKTAKQHGMQFDKWSKDGRLQFITADLIDINPDRLLYEVIRAIEKTNATRLVIDSVSSMENAAFDSNRIREFLLQLMTYLKQQGVTCMMTYLTTELFGATPGQLMSGTASTELGLSSMVDGIILLRYVERDQEVKKLLSILKMRGSTHEKSILEFSIGKGGIVLGEKFSD